MSTVTYMYFVSKKLMLLPVASAMTAIHNVHQVLVSNTHGQVWIRENGFHFLPFLYIIHDIVLMDEHTDVVESNLSMTVHEV